MDVPLRATLAIAARKNANDSQMWYGNALQVLRVGPVDGRDAECLFSDCGDGVNARKVRPQFGGESESEVRWGLRVQQVSDSRTVGNRNTWCRTYRRLFGIATGYGHQ